jgi:hypothetical protein
MSKDLNPVVRALADDLKPFLAIDEVTGVTNANHDKDVFEKHLPENLTLELLEAGQDFTVTAAAAISLAHGELQQAAMLKNKELASGSVKIKLGHVSIENSYTRKKSGTAMGKPWEKYGVSSTDVTIGVGRKGADLKAVVNYLAESASVFAN